MAVTPRFLYNNYAASASTITDVNGFLSGATSYPTAFLRDQLRTKVWRAPVGWNISGSAAGAGAVFRNDVIDWERNAVIYAANLVGGNYATGALMATELQTRIAATDTGSTYGVTYSAVNATFTITTSTSNTAKFLWTSGANAVASAGVDLGFTSDSTSGSSIASTTQTYHSREALAFDFGSAFAGSITAAIVVNHNSTGGTYQLLSSTSPVYTSATNWGAMSGTTDIRLTFAPTSSTNRYWWIIVSDVGNSDAYNELGIAYIGDYFQPDIAYGYGFSLDRDELATVQRGDGGAPFVDSRQAGRLWSLTFPETQNESSFRTMANLRQVGQCLFFSFDPATSPNNTVYGYFPSGMSMTNLESYPTLAFRVSLPFAEALG